MRSHQTQLLQHFFGVGKNKVLETKTLSFRGSVALTTPSTYPHQGQKSERFSATNSLGGTRNLKYKNKKSFYVIHLFKPNTSEIGGINAPWDEKTHMLSLLPLGLGHVGWVFTGCPKSHILCHSRFISTAHYFLLLIWTVNMIIEL